MKVYPRITGALCANSHPGSYTGQDAFNNMLPVVERNVDEVLGRNGYSSNANRSQCRGGTEDA